MASAIKYQTRNATENSINISRFAALTTFILMAPPKQDELGQESTHHPVECGVYGRKRKPYLKVLKHIKISYFKTNKKNVTCITKI